MARYDDSGVAPWFDGTTRDPNGNRAPGTAGIGPARTGAGVPGSPVPVQSTYVSSQIPRRPLPVQAGDTAGNSDGVPVHDSPLLAGGQVGNSPTKTGAGDGRVVTPHHPGAAGR
jgi:hypothetical protein